MSAQRHRFFATCAPGLEPLLHAELKQLRAAKTERQVGGVYFEGTMSDAWRANLCLRTAVRVLLRVARFQARDEHELYAGAQRVEWSEWLAPEGTLVVDGHSKESALEHTLFLEQRVKDAVVDQFRARHGVRPSVAKEGADLCIHVHLFRDRCTLLVDTSGESLHKRGWRVFQGRAPLAETLAAAVLLFSEWDQRSPLVDPCCGSGSLLIEAALLADKLPASALRKHFGFQTLPGHDETAWQLLRTRELAAAKPARKLVLRGFDADPAALEGMRANLANAGLEGRIQLEQAELSQFHPRKGWNAWLTSNLPYGERVGDVAQSGQGARAVEQLHRELGARLRAEGAGWHVGLLCGAARLAAALNLPGARPLALKNGALDCELLVAAL